MHDAQVNMPEANNKFRPQKAELAKPPKDPKVPGLDTSNRSKRVKGGRASGPPKKRRRHSHPDSDPSPQPAHQEESTMHVTIMHLKDQLLRVSLHDHWQ